MIQHWLMKAEPNSRIVKGKEVKVSASHGHSFISANLQPKFSVEDFEKVGTTSWEGVRNPEAKNIMKSMRVGDKVTWRLEISDEI
jgi:protein phosphatase-4 regulatory subunit 3